MKSLLDLCELPDNEAAVALDAYCRRTEAILRTSFMEMGLILTEFQNRLLWRKVQSLHSGKPFESFEEWIAEAAPYSRRHCFAAKGLYKELSKDISAVDLLAIPQSNANILAGVSSSLRPKLVKAAQTMQERELIEHIQKRHPDQHIEQRQAIHLKPTRGASEVIEQAIRLAMRIEGLTTREAALECICEEFIQDHQEEAIA